jgi:hypothetical protein
VVSARAKKQQAATAAGPRSGGRQPSSAAAVRRYLVALEKHQPRRGRPRTPKTLEDRLAKLDEVVASRGAAPAELEDDFAAVAADYAEKHGITYMAWRRLGVPARVLRKAGLSRGSGSAEDRSG